MKEAGGLFDIISLYCSAVKHSEQSWGGDVIESAAVPIASTDSRPRKSVLQVQTCEVVKLHFKYGRSSRTWYWETVIVCV